MDEGGIVKCDTRVLADGVYISGLGFGFTSTDLITLVYRTSDNVTKSFGTPVAGIANTPAVSFSPDNINFFGLNGRV